MPAGVHNITIEKGAKWTMTLHLVVGGAPKDLTGYTGAMKIRATLESPVVLSLTSSPAAGITINAAQGEVVVVVTASQATALPIAKGVYDLFLDPPSDDPTKLLVGNVEVVEAVTR